LVSKQQIEWLELWDIYKMENLKPARIAEDQQKMDDIKKSLWL
jgi:hypothetical protein